MKSQIAIKIIAIYLILAGTSASFSQENSVHGAHHAMQAAPLVPVQTPVTPYAGQQSREIKALSANQAQDILEGKGMELAKAAELNGYPGPMHVLELAQALQLNQEQRASTQQLLT